MQEEIEKIDREIENLKKMKARLEFQEAMENIEPEISFDRLAKIGQENRIPSEVRILYQEEVERILTEYATVIKDKCENYYKQQHENSI